MAKSFKTLIEKMPLERRAKIDTLTQELLTRIPLEELRQARVLAQEQVAATLKLTPEDVSRIENEADIYIGTLRRFIEAMGGELSVVAHFPNGNVKIETFQEFATLPSDSKEDSRKHFSKSS